ncbi:hypothetical protein G3N55_08185 [Dissulfurirhabdus thermomarina]|uniref:Uncharacterized protein n=1 Tax=Dissulfurirhabdus thermomarina TaxID=1765737 RepID=A0A6N9TQU7_DISTH|nr:hypothetical protein [Dissulfurirhabdus thermomarina]NDY42820.1 hypothetical protein [Dissulfurirhabdus thermomarina]NMX22549.1 hypothetical protein [Dissulfurirhabdus thermomarina]
MGAERIRRRVAVLAGLAAACALLAGCDVPVLDSPLAARGCRRCHPVRIDPAHDLACTRCHGGDPSGRTRAAAHRGLVAEPAHPDRMAATCGGCHPAETAAAARDRHFTLAGEIGAVWGAFFPGDRPPALSALPVEEPPETARGLVADLLRRRCLRCHVYDRGDDYAGVRHGTGCAACHLARGGGGLASHRFTRRVPDERCLACHYANFVGWDYYGRFEKDYEEDYRAPLSRGEPLPRPYGVEWHEMTPDVHRRAGLACTDCHPAGPCSDRRRARGCLDCHLGGGQRGGAPGLDAARVGHRPADRARVDCAVCHAVWSVRDRGRALTRQDAPDYDFWWYLRVQGSSEVERIVTGNVEFRPPYRPPSLMRDKVSGRSRPGVWFEGFFDRRWTPVPVGPDGRGRLRVLRPVLDLSVSYLDADGLVPFDNLRPAGLETPAPVECREVSPACRPYTPHTIGRADALRTLRVERWLRREGAGARGR